MGFGYCRVEGCNKRTEIDRLAWVTDGKLFYSLVVCGIYKDYVINHKFQPTGEERKVVMNSERLKPEEKELIKSKIDKLKEVRIMFVDRRGTGYTHEIGDSPDMVWVNKLDELLAEAKFVVYRGY